jgi:hypothetical protein
VISQVAHVCSTDQNYAKDCGENLYLDFSDYGPGATEFTRAILQDGQGSSLTSSRLQTTAHLESSAAARDSPTNLCRDAISGPSLSVSGIEGQGFTVNQSLSTNELSGPIGLNDNTCIYPAVFFELCVNTSEHLKTLGEIDLSKAQCDGDLFSAIQERYVKIRGWRSKYWLLKPAKISYVRVCILQSIHFNK